MANHFLLNASGIIAYGGATVPTWMANLSLATATTTNANDSIKITGYDGTALSTTNPGWITLPSTATAGRLVTFQVTADVTINLTGAHWGAGAKGDLVGALLRVLAINDNGTLKWGVAKLGGRCMLLTTDTSATGSSVSLAEHVLCTSAVGSASNTCREVGYVRSNFDDTGGAAEDLWANQTGLNDIVTGSTADGIWQPGYTTPVFTGFSADPTVTHYIWSQVGRQIYINFKHATAGTSSLTTYTLQAVAKARRLSSFSCTEAKDASVDLSDPPMVRTAADSATLSLFKDLRATAWTNSGTKFADFNICYEVGPAASFIE